MEVDDDTLVSTSYTHRMDNTSTFKVWNKTTGECRRSFVTPKVLCLLRLRNNNSTFLCGIQKQDDFFQGHIEERRLDDFEVVHTLKHADNERCVSMCELSNGNVINGGYFKMIHEWNMKTRTVVRSFVGHSGGVSELIELKDKTILSLPYDGKTVKIWNGTTGKCLKTLKHSKSVSAVVVLSDGTLLTGSDDKIYEWNEKGKCVSTSKLYASGIGAIKELPNGSIVISSSFKMQVRKTWLR